MMVHPTAAVQQDLFNVTVVQRSPVLFSTVLPDHVMNPCNKSGEECLGAVGIRCSFEKGGASISGNVISGLYRHGLIQSLKKPSRCWSLPG